MPAPKSKWQERDVWFTAGHRLGSGFVDVAVEAHNERVESEDLVWHLGGLTEPGYANLAGKLLGRITAIAGPGDEYFAGTPDTDAEAAAERLKSLGGVQAVITGRAFRKSRTPIQIPLGFGFAPVLLWSLPYTGPIDTAPWRPPIPSKSERLWILHGEKRSAVNPTAREISVHRDAWDGKPVNIDDIRDIIRKLS
jgi:calcineurin-like phosphoesterase family protein